jgi:hypothetical protein
MVHHHVGETVADLMVCRVAGRIWNKQLPHFMVMIFSKQMRRAAHVTEG